jgi:shikimate dehydrogenase
MPIAKGMKCGVLGNPIEHSLSPILHRAAYDVLKIDWQFEKYLLNADELRPFLESSDSSVAGYAVTMPLKDVAFSLATSVDDYASATRAVNTLIPGAEGWQGFNTDVPGFINSLRAAGISKVENPVVLGAGATARSAVAALHVQGAKRIRVVARRESAVAEMQSLFPKIELQPLTFGSDEVAGDVVISTLPAGVADAVKISASTALFYDVIYAPWPTVSVRQAQNLGVAILGGLDLLVAQAVEQVILMTGCDESLRPTLSLAMRAAGEVTQRERSQSS